MNLPPALRRSLEREAHRRGLGLSTTLRALVIERIQELTDDEELGRAEAWQRAQAWAAWDRVRAGAHKEVTRGELMAAFVKPRRQGRK